MLSEQDIQPYSTQSSKFLEVFEKDKFEFEIPIPDSLNTTYLDLFKRNDSILYKKYLDNKTYCLGQNYKWTAIDKTDDLIYQDKDFYVTSLDFGEFGQRTWFKDKKTKKEYITDEFTYIINKLNKEYFITTPKNIYKISNPRKLMISSKDESYENYRNTNKNPYNYLNYGELQPLLSNESEDFYIVTSFIFQNNLYHICRAKNETYIGEIKEGQMKIIQNLPNDVIPFRRYFNYRNKLQNNKQIIQFKTDKPNTFGIIEIDNGIFSIFYFNNNLKLEYLGYEKSKISLTSKIDYLLENIGKINLLEVEKYEENPILVNHSMRLQYKSKINQDFKGPKIYKQIEDNYLELHTLYSYSNEGLIEGVTFDWNRNVDYENKVKYIDSDARNIGRNDRYLFLKDYLVSKAGKPILEIQDGDNRENTWEIDDRTIQLNQGKYYLEMKIFIN